MPHVAARTASRDRDTGRYQSHRPEQTLLYQIVDEYYPAFAAFAAANAGSFEPNPKFRAFGLARSLLHVDEILICFSLINNSYAHYFFVSLLMQLRSQFCKCELSVFEMLRLALCTQTTI